jgi:hypothetical protein
MGRVESYKDHSDKRPLELHGVAKWAVSIQLKITFKGNHTTTVHCTYHGTYLFQLFVVYYTYSLLEVIVVTHSWKKSVTSYISTGLAVGSR